MASEVPEVDPFGDSLKDKGKFYGRTVSTYKKLLLDDSSTDLVITIGKDTVHAHAAVVCCRCEEIIGFPDEKAKKKKKHEVKLKETQVASGAIMTKVLEFLYTGMVEFPKLSDKEILMLNRAARFFKLSRLSYLCERWLIQNMTIESVFHLLKAATDLDEERIKGFCLKFALANYNAFISNKDGIYILGIELFQEVVAAFQTNPPVPDEITPENAPPDTIVPDFRKLYEKMPYSDSSILIGNTTLRFHKFILNAISESLATAVTRDSDSEVKISADALATVLRFCYYGDSKVDPVPGCELIGFCRKFNLPELLQLCEELIRNSVTPQSVLSILAVSYLPGGKPELVEEIRGKCVPFLLQNLDQVDFSRIRTFNPMMVVDLLGHFQDAAAKGIHGFANLKAPGDYVRPGHAANVSANRNVSGGGGAAALPPPVVGVPSSGLARVDSGSGEALALGREPSGGAAPPPRNRPPPPPRNLVSQQSSGKLPPPSLGASESGAGVSREKSLPPPFIGGGASGGSQGGNGNAGGSLPPPNVSGGLSSSSADANGSGDVGDDPKSRLARRKSQKDMKSELKEKKPSKKDKKEEDKRKKEEQKRIDKERKERSKMEKKFKGKGGEIF